MTYVTWGFAIWGGSLAYTMVGALAWRSIYRVQHTPCHGITCPNRQEGVVSLMFGNTMFLCTKCEDARERAWQAALWPVAIPLTVACLAIEYVVWPPIKFTVRALIYIPFRAAARAIAKPGDAG